MQICVSSAAAAPDSAGAAADEFQSKDPGHLVWSSNLLLGPSRTLLTISGLVPAKQGGTVYRFYRYFATFCIIGLIHVTWLDFGVLGFFAEREGLPCIGLTFLCSAELLFVAFSLTYILAQRYLADAGGLEFLAQGLCNAPITAWPSEHTAVRRMSQVLRDSTRGLPLAMRLLVGFALSSSIGTIALFLAITAPWVGNNICDPCIYMWSISWALLVVPHQFALYAITMFLPWLVGRLHSKDLDEFCRLATDCLDAFLAKEIDADACRDRLTSLEAPVALRFKQTSAHWSVIIVLSIGSMGCFVFGITYMLFLSDDLELIDRGGLYTSVLARILFSSFFVIMFALSLALSCLLARTTNYAKAMVGTFETPRIMNASNILWGAPHAYNDHLNNLGLGMRVLDNEFSLSTVFKIICTLVGSTVFVIFGAILDK